MPGPGILPRMELLHRVTGPVDTNVWVLGDEASREAIGVDTATPSVDWLTARSPSGLDAQARRQHPPPLGPHR